MNRKNVKYQDIALAGYLEVTRKAGLSDQLAIDTYNNNKDSADKLTEIVVNNTIKNGKKMEKLMNNSQEKNIAGERLMSFIERIERLEEEKIALMEDIKEVYSEVKGVGFDVKTVKKLVSLRKVDKQKRIEESELLELYQASIGMGE